MQLARHQAAGVQSPSHIEPGAMVESTSNCIGWDSGPTPGNPTDRHFLMLRGQLSSCWSGSQNILLLGFTTETKVRVCKFLGSQCSMLSASSCLVPISIHLRACHNSYRLSTFANCYKVFNASGGKVRCHVEINSSVRRYVNN